MGINVAFLGVFAKNDRWPENAPGRPESAVFSANSDRAILMTCPCEREASGEADLIEISFRRYISPSGIFCTEGLLRAPVRHLS